MLHNTCLTLQSNLKSEQLEIDFTFTFTTIFDAIIYTDEPAANIQAIHSKALPAFRSWHCLDICRWNTVVQRRLAFPLVQGIPFVENYNQHHRGRAVLLAFIFQDII